MSLLRVGMRVSFGVRTEGLQMLLYSTDKLGELDDHPLTFQ